MDNQIDKQLHSKRGLILSRIESIYATQSTQALFKNIQRIDLTLRIPPTDTNTILALFSLKQRSHRRSFRPESHLHTIFYFPNKRSLSSPRLHCRG